MAIICAPDKGPVHKLVGDTYVHVLTHREALGVDESPPQDTTPQDHGMLSNATRLCILLKLATRDTTEIPPVRITFPFSHFTRQKCSCRQPDHTPNTNTYSSAHASYPGISHSQDPTQSPRHGAHSKVLVGPSYSLSRRPVRSRRPPAAPAPERRRPPARASAGIRAARSAPDARLRRAAAAAAGRDGIL